MNRIKELREELGITMREAANRLKMPYTTYVNYEKGVREPNSETLILLAKFFGVTVDYLIGNVSEPYFHLDNERIKAELNSYGDEDEKTPAESGRREVTDDDIKFALFGGKGEITDAMYDEVKDFAQYVKHRETKKANEHIFVQPSSEDRSLKVASPVLRPTANKEKE